MENSASLFGVNKLFLGQSIFTVNLEEDDDPLKWGYSMSTMFRVTNLETPVTSEQINAILSRARDPEGGGNKVPYEIISNRAEDHTFIVAARIKSVRTIQFSRFIPAYMDQIADTLE
eukprot:854707_1